MRVSLIAILFLWERVALVGITPIVSKLHVSWGVYPALAQWDDVINGGVVHCGDCLAADSTEVGFSKQPHLNSSVDFASVFHIVFSW